MSSKDENANVAANLQRFDQLDFDAYSHRKDMPLFRKLHCDDVEVVYADGRTTLGIEAHVQDVHSIFFNGTPDSRITTHPIRIGCFSFRDSEARNTASSAGLRT